MYVILAYLTKEITGPLVLHKSIGKDELDNAWKVNPEDQGTKVVTFNGKGKYCIGIYCTLV